MVAGLTVWAVLVPEALAYASIAGVSPVVGLYAAPGALLLYAAFGSSRHLVTGPMSATAALAAVVIAAVVELIDFPALAALYRIATRHLRHRRPARLHRRRGRPGRGAGLRHPPRAVHRRGGVAAAAGVPGLTSPCGRPRPGPGRPRPVR
ncbi:MAG: SulP family inorganic anion transporter [Actinomycetes bacterium]